MSFWAGYMLSAGKKKSFPQTSVQCNYRVSWAPLPSYLSFWDKSHMNGPLCSSSSTASTTSLSVIDLLSVSLYFSMSHTLSNSVLPPLAFEWWSRKHWVGLLMSWKHTFLGFCIYLCVIQILGFKWQKKNIQNWHFKECFNPRSYCETQVGRKLTNFHSNISDMCLKSLCRDGEWITVLNK